MLSTAQSWTGRFVNAINLIASLITLWAVGGALIVAGIVSGLLSFARIGESWSLIVGAGIFVLALGAGITLTARIRERRRSPASTSGPAESAEGDPDEHLAHGSGKELYELTSLLDRWDELMQAFGHEVLEYVCNQPDPSVPIPGGALSRALSAVPGTIVQGMPHEQVLRLIEDAQAHARRQGLPATSRDISYRKSTSSTRSPGMSRPSGRSRSPRSAASSLEWCSPWMAARRPFPSRRSLPPGRTPAISRD
jgi:hypothetical protein